MHLEVESLGMTWDFNSSNMEELHVNEKEWAMGFHINTTTMPSIFEGPCKQNLGKLWTFIASRGFLVCF